MCKYSCLLTPSLSFLHSFQIGNAAYHNDNLYEELKRSIPQLANLLLSAEEDKTKANAAGALSNLVRNSNKLCEDIVSEGALQVCGHACCLLILLCFGFFLLSLRVRVCVLTFCLAMICIRVSF